MSEVRCPVHGWTLEVHECRSCFELRDAVYDAAMAYLAAVEATQPSMAMGRNLFQEQADAEAARQSLIAVCRRSKEGR